MYRYRGKKITCPGARDKLNFRQDKHIFSPNVWRTSKKLNASIYFSLTRTSYLVTGQVKILMGLPGGQVKIFRFFYPCDTGDRFIEDHHRIISVLSYLEWTLMDKLYAFYKLLFPWNLWQCL